MFFKCCCHKLNSWHNSTSVHQMATRVYVCLKFFLLGLFGFSSLIYSHGFSRSGSAVCCLSKGPVSGEWRPLLDCAVLPHDHCDRPEPSGTQRTFCFSCKFLHLGKQDLVACQGYGSMVDLLNDSRKNTSLCRG